MSDGAILNLLVQFETITCYKCHMQFAVPVVTRRKWLDKGATFYCPNGHNQHYTVSEVQRLERKLTAERGAREFANRRLQSELNSHRATRGHLTRAKKRAAHGVCPCCKRTFKDVARHMDNKHPEYVAENG